MRSFFWTVLRVIALLLLTLLGGSSFVAALVSGAMVRRPALAHGIALTIAVVLSFIASGPAKLPHPAWISIRFTGPVYIDGASSLIATLVVRLFFAWWGCSTGQALRAGFEEAKRLARVSTRRP